MTDHNTDKTDSTPTSNQGKDLADIEKGKQTTLDEKTRTTGTGEPSDMKEKAQSEGQPGRGNQRIAGNPNQGGEN